MTEAERLAQALRSLHESKKYHPSGPGGQMCGSELYRLVASGIAFEDLQNAAALLRSQAAEIEAALPIVREYARANPKHYWRDTMQDPRGAHAWLARNDPDAAIDAARQS